MKYLRSTKNGFSLTEVVMGTMLLAVVWVAAMGTLVISRSAVTYARHKVQAIYVAQRILEEQRRLPFPTIVSQPSSPVSIDTKGTFDTNADDMLGNRIITVTNLDTYRKRVSVEINWNERTPGTNLIMREYCTDDIANEPQLN